MDRAKPSGVVEGRSERTFRCVEFGTAFYLLMVIHDGRISERIALTAAEARACANALLVAVKEVPHAR